MNPDEFYPLNNDQLARLYKREKINSLLNELHTMQETYIEEALKTSDLREAQEVLDYIRKKY